MKIHNNFSGSSSHNFLSFGPKYKIPMRSPSQLHSTVYSFINKIRNKVRQILVALHLPAMFTSIKVLILTFACCVAASAVEPRFWLGGSGGRGPSGGRGSMWAGAGGGHGGSSGGGHGGNSGGGHGGSSGGIHGGSSGVGHGGNSGSGHSGSSGAAHGGQSGSAGGGYPGAGTGSYFKGGAGGSYSGGAGAGGSHFGSGGGSGGGSSGGQGGGYRQENYPPRPYNFSYIVNDRYSGANFGQMEISDGDTVRGQYRVALPDGRTQIVTYNANWKTGYNANVQYQGEARYPEPGPNSGRPSSGYNNNNNISSGYGWPSSGRGQPSGNIGGHSSSQSSGYRGPSSGNGQHSSNNGGHSHGPSSGNHVPAPFL